jgi:cell division protein FtsQ
VLPLLAAGLAAGYFGWLRDSSLVAVREVEITGLAGPEAQEATAALTAAAKEMTTLNVDSEQLAAAVEGFPTVAGLRADAGFPNTLAILVEERPPVLVARSGGEGVPVAGDGTLLRGVELAEGSEELPAIDLRELPAERLAGEPLAMALVLGAAPQPLRELVEDVSYTDENGVEVVLRGQIPVRFGTGARAADKWAAAAAVLADPRLKELSYVDVRVPERPAVGGAAPPATEDKAEAGTETTATVPTAPVAAPTDPLATAPDPVVGP